MVRNVHEFPGHIVCDSNSLSEIVVPLVHDVTVSIFGHKDLFRSIVNCYIEFCEYCVVDCRFLNFEIYIIDIIDILYIISLMNDSD